MHPSELPPPPKGKVYSIGTNTITESTMTGISYIYEERYVRLDSKGSPILDDDPDYGVAVLDDALALEGELDAAWAFNRQLVADIEFVESTAKKEQQQRQLLQDEIDRLQHLLSRRDKVINETINFVREDIATGSYPKALAEPLTILLEEVLREVD